MADVAQPVACPQCGSLTGCSGDYDSETLTGMCPLGHQVSVAQHRVEMVAVAPGHPIASPQWVQVKGNPNVPQAGTETVQSASTPEPNTLNARFEVATGQGVPPPQEAPVPVPLGQGAVLHPQSEPATYTPSETPPAPGA